MTRHRLEVADVFRTCESELIEQSWSKLSIDQRRAFHAITACRTKAQGGHIEQCDRCGRERNAYNSCRNRHCPKCQAMARAKWMEARAAELLPIPYFHVVFTLPRNIGPIALQNKKTVYGILFRAAADTLKELAADPKHLGAEIGILQVLHTWGQSLVHHPHIHCVVSGGGIAPDGKHWVPCKKSKRSKKEFFIPTRVLAAKFRGKFIAYLKRAFRKGELKFHGTWAALHEPSEFERWLDKAVRKRWVVFAKRPFARPRIVLKYLARYTHRVAISNNRLINMANGVVHFHWKDYADGAKRKTMPLAGTEFIRRFLLHVVPTGFMRIRHSGFLANRYRSKKLDLCRRLLGVAQPAAVEIPDAIESTEGRPETDVGQPCPFCGDGRMNVIEKIPAEVGELDVRRIGIRPCHPQRPP